MPLIMLLSIWMLKPEISMDRMGLYEDTQLTLFKTPRGYLLNSRKESVAVLFSAEGRVLGRYDRRGNGPDEFNRQYVLKIDERGIHFCSNGRYVLSFDHDLKPAPARLPNLPQHPHLNSDFGLVRGQNVLVSLAGRPHLFAELRQTGGEWQVTRGLFNTGTDHSSDGRQYLATGKRPLVHHQTMFASKVSVSGQEDHYEIEVYSDFMKAGDAQSPSNMLVGDIGEFPLFAGMRALIYGAVQTPEGFVVELFSHLRTGGRYRRWQDHFDHHGRFLKRVPANGIRILPVLNSGEVFQLEDLGENWILKKIH